eukprot:jgi/Chlat1/7855/Chrsp66S07289
MEREGEAAVGRFPIGPSSVYGRLLAVRILCSTRLRLWTDLFLAIVQRRFKKVTTALSYVGRSLAQRLDPRNPLSLVAAAALVLWLSHRARLGQAQRQLKRARVKYYTQQMARANCYDEWYQAARALDNLQVSANDATMFVQSLQYEGEDERKVDMRFYDVELVEDRLQKMVKLREEGNIGEMVFCLRADLLRNLGGLCNPQLHKSRLTTPHTIQEYIHEVTLQLKYVCNYDFPDFPLEEKLAFFHETRHAFGRTALLFSGGAALGSFHLGVMKALVEHKLLPRVIAGSSVGSIVCSFTATRTQEELEAFFKGPLPDMIFFAEVGSLLRFARRLVTKGALHEIGTLQKRMRSLIGDLTFQEAFDISGRILGISVCSMRQHEAPRLLNYLTSPHVVIWSAVAASCAFPGLFEAQELLAKDREGRLVPFHIGEHDGDGRGLTSRKWRDGSVEEDLPMTSLKELFNVNHFVVSQANPHIAPILRLKEILRQSGGPYVGHAMHMLEMEVKHRLKQLIEMGIGSKGIAKILAQDWEGDITIVMPATLYQMYKIIQNPTKEDVQLGSIMGERCTWAKLSSIRANCAIEMALDECVQELKAKRKLLYGRSHGRGFDGRQRIPSWNTLLRPQSVGSLSDGEDDHSTFASLRSYGNGI